MTIYEEHRVSFGDGKTIFYLAAGPLSGPLLIFMHGWPAIAKTWQPQIKAFALLGFRVVAPDMPGYGQSTARHIKSDYSQQEVVKGMLAVLADTKRETAVWVGHDWGCATLWTLANTHPEVCRAVIGLTVPFGTLELGLEELVKTVDRKLYPENEFPYGQWDYMVFYEQSFDKASSFFDKGIHGFLNMMMRRVTDPSIIDTPSFTSTVVKAGGWFGGMDEPPPPEANVPDDAFNMEVEILNELIAAMEKTGFGPGDSWYMNHKENREYNLNKTKNNMKLEIPVLFIHARYDFVCQSVIGKLADRMRSSCPNLTEKVIDAGHLVASEKPEETNSAIAKWLLEKVPDWWPRVSSI
ncbi:hypothetical protein NQ176_g52 [Zarea fungicola]|uniref:Uncharacterized protein n=1 Tax=Zarea fungicola TaxID=93591 RepID=A0ACC1NZN4_9HYPO|nr:hypothetical protein NQ176_g52 [Lecanicillium fungicola]